MSFNLLKYLKAYMHARLTYLDTTPIWVDIQGLDDEDLKIVGKLFGLHPLTLEDCTVPDTREKFDNRHVCTLNINFHLRLIVLI